MKKETFEKAQTLNQKIEDYDRAIGRIEKNDKDCGGYAINLSFCYDEDDEDLKKAVTSYLKQKRGKLQKEFDLLK